MPRKRQLTPAMRKALTVRGVPEETSKYERLSETDKHLILVLASEKRTQQEIAAAVKCSQSAVSGFLLRVSSPAKVVQQVLKSHELDATEAWARAIQTAAKRGDHRPARELIEAANPELRPTAGNLGAGGGVTINIGMPGQPLELPIISVGQSESGAISTGDERKPFKSLADRTNVA